MRIVRALVYTSLCQNRCLEGRGYIASKSINGNNLVVKLIILCKLIHISFIVFEKNFFIQTELKS